MPVGPGPRFVIEAVFIVGVAVVAAVSKLGNVGIILSIFAAWVVVAAVEWTASRQTRPAADGAATAETTPDSAHQHVHVLPRADEPAAEPEPVAAAPEPEPEPEAPTAEQEPAPAVAEEGAVLPEPEPQEEPEPEPEPEPAAPVLTAVPELPPEPAAQPPPAPSAPPQPTVVPFGSRGPVEWNLWDLERLTREHAGRDELKDEERAYLLMYLRDFASADGILPVDFDGLVRSSFGELVGVS